MKVKGQDENKTPETVGVEINLAVPSDIDLDFLPRELDAMFQQNVLPLLVGWVQYQRPHFDKEQQPVSY
jgi:hypothetical protein